MTIVVAYKYAANPQDASVGADGRVDWSRAKPAVSEYDPVAIQVGRELADATGQSLVGITVGNAAAGSSLARKASLSRGLDRAVLVADDAVLDWSPTRIGSALAALVTRLGDADLVLTGDASVDEGAQLMPAIIAGHLGWPCFLEVSEISRIADGWLLVQAHQGGTRTISVTGAAVIAVTTDATEARTPGMKDILAAGRKPVEQIDLAELPVSDAHLAVLGRSRPEAPQRQRQLFNGERAADQLITALRSAGVL